MLNRICQIHPHPHHGNLHFIEYFDDAQKYQVQEGQRWLPKSLDASHHPAKVGDIVTLSKFLVERYGISVAFVSGVRLFKEARSSDFDTDYQIELLGIPREWFTLGHFKEYYTDHSRAVRKMDGCRIYHHAIESDFY